MRLHQNSLSIVHVSIKTRFDEAPRHWWGAISAIYCPCIHLCNQKRVYALSPTSVQTAIEKKTRTDWWTYTGKVDQGLIGSVFATTATSFGEPNSSFATRPARGNKSWSRLRGAKECDQSFIFWQPSEQTLYTGRKYQFAFVSDITPTNCIHGMSARHWGLETDLDAPPTWCPDCSSFYTRDTKAWWTYHAYISEEEQTQKPKMHRQNTNNPWAPPVRTCMLTLFVSSVRLHNLVPAVYVLLSVITNLVCHGKAKLDVSTQDPLGLVTEVERFSQRCPDRLHHSATVGG